MVNFTTLHETEKVRKKTICSAHSNRGYSDVTWISLLVIFAMYSFVHLRYNSKINSYLPSSWIRQRIKTGCAAITCFISGVGFFRDVSLVYFPCFVKMALPVVKFCCFVRSLADRRHGLKHDCNCSCVTADASKTSIEIKIPQPIAHELT